MPAATRSCTPSAGCIEITSSARSHIPLASVVRGAVRAPACVSVVVMLATSIRTGRRGHALARRAAGGARRAGGHAPLLAQLHQQLAVALAHDLPPVGLVVLGGVGHQGRALLGVL